MDSSSAKHRTTALFTFAFLLFGISELVVVTSLWNIPNGELNLGIAAKYVLPCIVGLPMVSGIQGYFISRRRLLSTNSNTAYEFSFRFLTIIIVAYAAIIFLVSALQR